MTAPPQQVLPLKVCFSPFLTGMAKGSLPMMCVVKLSSFAGRISSWSCMAAILSDCIFWTSLSPSSLSRMTWNESWGSFVEVEALFLFALLLGVDSYPAASASVSIGSPSSYAAPSSSTSPGSRNCILMMVCLLIAEGVGIRLRSWGIGTPFGLKIRMRKLGKISLAREVVLVSSIIVSNIWELISMNVFSLSSIRKWLWHCWL